jgi:hypothetical protein
MKSGPGHIGRLGVERSKEWRPSKLPVQLLRLQIA